MEDSKIHYTLRHMNYKQSMLYVEKVRHFNIDHKVVLNIWKQRNKSEAQQVINIQMGRTLLCYESNWILPSLT